MEDWRVIPLAIWLRISHYLSLFDKLHVRDVCQEWRCNVEADFRYAKIDASTIRHGLWSEYNQIVLGISHEDFHVNQPTARFPANKNKALSQDIAKTTIEFCDLLLNATDCIEVLFIDRISLPCSYLKKLLTRQKALRELKLHLCHEKRDEGPLFLCILEGITKHQSSLQKIIIDGESRLPSGSAFPCVGDKSVLLRCPRLKTLKIRGVVGEMLLSKLSIDSCPLIDNYSLTSESLRGSWLGDDRRFHEKLSSKEGHRLITEMFPLITHLEITVITSEFDLNSYQQILRHYGSQLRSLKVFATDEIIQIITDACPNLVSLFCRCKFCPKDESIRLFAKLKRVRKFGLSCWNSVVSTDVLTELLENIGRNLTRFSLLCTTQDISQIYDAVTEYCFDARKLELMIVENGDYDEDRIVNSLIKMLRSCTKLCSFTFGHERHEEHRDVNFEIANVLATECKSLKKLTFGSASLSTATRNFAMNELPFCEICECSGRLPGIYNRFIQKEIRVLVKQAQAERSRKCEIQ